MSQEEAVKTTSDTIDVQQLEARHEEADTRIILHCVKNQESNCIVVQARDTDVLVLLVAHFHRMACNKLWLKAGTARKRKFIPVHDIVATMSFSQEQLESIVDFHAYAGCDIVLFFSGHGKKTAWHTFTQYSHLLKGLGVVNLTQETEDSVQEFICHLYKVDHITSVNKAQSYLFLKSKAPETLPPTYDALSFYIKRAHYQSSIWRQAHINFPDIPEPEDSGWRLMNDELQPILMSAAPVPDSCLELISCGCQGTCINLQCKCRKSNLLCSP